MAHLTSTWRSRIKRLAENGNSSAQQLLDMLPQMGEDEGAQLRAQAMAQNIYLNATQSDEKDEKVTNFREKEDTSEENRETTSQISAENIKEMNKKFLSDFFNRSPEQQINLMKLLRNKNATPATALDDTRKLLSDSFNEFLERMGVKSDPTGKYKELFSERYGYLDDVSKTNFAILLFRALKEVL